MQWISEAPSNIALIKYMGKKDSVINLPANASLSYTLPHLSTCVELTPIGGATDVFEALPESRYPFTLSEAGQLRFLAHLQRLKQQFHYQGAFRVRSANDFPQGTGLASSASSFAALTRCAVAALCDLTHIPVPSLSVQAAWSREGSGSSCRSFFAPWALWEEATVSPVTFPQYTALHHRVIVVSATEKAVSSSEAHRRIQHSAYYSARAERAEANLAALYKALNAADWHQAYTICWREFEDMHQLFETANPAFSYRPPETLALLAQLKASWETTGDGPLVTMDAGPNIHLLYRPSQIDAALRFEHDHVRQRFAVFHASEEGSA